MSPVEQTSEVAPRSWWRTSAATRRMTRAPSTGASVPGVARGRVRITPNLFGVPFGLAGLAGTWTAAARTVDTATWPGNVLWLLAAATWVAVLGAFLINARTRLGAELADPISAPFLALAVITPMLLGLALNAHAKTAGEVMALVFLGLMVLLGGWLTGSWMIADLSLEQWHPGYFLPTVAGGLLGSGVAADLGHRELAQLLFGYGLICWLVLGSILIARLFIKPMLPTALLPTMAIEVAPPVVAGHAWFALNGGRVDAFALGLAGYAVLMVLVQIRLIPLYRTVPFGPSSWAFTFSYAAVFTVAIEWLAAEQAAGARTLTGVLLAVVTIAFASLLAQTTADLAHGSFLPRFPAPGRSS